ncbi:WG repeat-containing protein [Myroides odoratimimus]|uniref:WG repeat-containing protein n=1 Tax=Myroides odoratimimus TaxID=76832 RepID=UPI0024DF8E92|nr:WG repeat-containing protein [Myroides odoratimimus]WHT72183.1 WG repeat-containing protein [Myroides odoratimimus]
MNTTLTNKTAAIYPFVDEKGMYGYCNQDKQIVISQQYASGGLFTKSGYAVVRDKQGMYGVIDLENKEVLKCRYDRIELYEVGCFTVANIVQSYTVHSRFWQWKFLPNFNIMSTSSSFKPLWGTEVIREKVTVLALDTRQVLDTKTVTKDKLYRSGTSIKIKQIGSKLIQVGDDLYFAKKDRLKRIVKKVVSTYDNGLRWVRKVNDDEVRVYNLKGKRVKSYEVIPQPIFPITYKGKEYKVSMQTAKSHLIAKPTICRDTIGNGRYYVNYEFDMYIPVHLKVIDIKSERSIQDIWKNLLNIYPVVSKHFFIVEVAPISTESRVNEFYILTKHGVLKDCLDKPSDYSITSYYNEVLWPAKELLIDQKDIPQGFLLEKIRTISSIKEPLYFVSIKKDQVSRVGVWNVDLQEWLLSPIFYSLRLMDNIKYCVFQLEENGLYGILDITTRTVVYEPIFTYVKDGAEYLAEVELEREKGEVKNVYNCFYINLVNGEEFHPGKDILEFTSRKV